MGIWTMMRAWQSFLPTGKDQLSSLLLNLPPSALRTPLSTLPLFSYCEFFHMLLVFTIPPSPGD